jgi:hypothetical protein
VNGRALMDGFAARPPCSLQRTLQQADHII